MSNYALRRALVIYNVGNQLSKLKFIIRRKRVCEKEFGKGVCMNLQDNEPIEPITILPEPVPEPIPDPNPAPQPAPFPPSDPHPSPFPAPPEPIPAYPPEVIW